MVKYKYIFLLLPMLISNQLLADDKHKAPTFFDGLEYVKCAADGSMNGVVFPKGKPHCFYNDGKFVSLKRVEQICGVQLSGEPNKIEFTVLSSGHTKKSDFVINASVNEDLINPFVKYPSVSIQLIRMKRDLAEGAIFPQTIVFDLPKIKRKDINTTIDDYKVENLVSLRHECRR